MTNVLFYRLANSTGSLLPVLVNLLEMSLSKNLDTLIMTNDRKSALPLHNHLAERFQLGSEMTLAESPGSRFSLCWGDNPGNHHGVLINLTDRLPRWFSRFEILAEIICGNDHFVERKRENYRLCLNRGYPLQYHDLTKVPLHQPLI